MKAMRIGNLVKDKRTGDIGVVYTWRSGTDDAIWVGVHFTAGQRQTIHEECLEVISESR